MFIWRRKWRNNKKFKFIYVFGWWKSIINKLLLDMLILTPERNKKVERIRISSWYMTTNGSMRMMKCWHSNSDTFSSTDRSVVVVVLSNTTTAAYAYTVNLNRNTTVNLVTPYFAVLNVIQINKKTTTIKYEKTIRLKR